MCVLGEMKFRHQSSTCRKDVYAYLFGHDTWHLIFALPPAALCAFGKSWKPGVESLQRDSYVWELVWVKTNLILIVTAFPTLSCLAGTLYSQFCISLWEVLCFWESPLPERSSELYSQNFTFSVLWHLKLSPPGFCLILGFKDKGLKTEGLKAPSLGLPLVLNTASSRRAEGTLQTAVSTSICAPSSFPGRMSQLASNVFLLSPISVTFSFQFFSMHFQASKLPQKSPWEKNDCLVTQTKRALSLQSCMAPQEKSAV